MAKFKRLASLFLFCMAATLFAAQTLQAFGIVQFHAEFFEKKGTVIVDAGHGGEDGGAVGVDGTLEKDINLSIAIKLRDYLKQNNFEVIMVRDGDYAVGDSSLSTVAERKRSDTVNRLKLVESVSDCILLSIHQNYFTESKYSGAQMFYSPNNENSAVLAEYIRKSVVTSLQPENERENKAADESIYLMYNTSVPAVLVECGFLSNPEEAAKLSDETYQSNMAAAIYNGLIDYLEALK